MSDSVLISLFLIVCAVAGAAVLLGSVRRRPAVPRLPAPTAVGIGTVCTVCTVTDRITVEVESVCGRRFTGRLKGSSDDPVIAGIKPGAVLLVAFDPHSREQLSLADDMAAIRAAFDQMLVGKGLVTTAQLALIRHGIKGAGVVTAAEPTGAIREDYREVVLDLMVRRPDGGQFPAHEITLIPATALDRVSPGAVIDAYYRADDESAVAVCVPPA